MKLRIVVLRSGIMKYVFVLFCLLFQNALWANTQIIVGESASDMECYAGSELQRYLYQLTSELPEVVNGPVEINMPSFVVGTQLSNSLLASFVSQGLITVAANDPGAQGYVIKKIIYNNQPVIAILGADEVGAMYGVYGLLEDYYGIGFYFSGDVVPTAVPSLTLPEIDERKTPAMYIRGFLPWTNFPQSATVYSWEDWKYVIDQMTKMRMNFLLIHNYNAEGGHNEMYHNFTLDGITSKVWMPTAKTGHAWGGPGWEPDGYQFGAKDVFDDYDFGASCGLHNENLSNLDIFAKGVILFQRVIAYAHSRGVKIGLGLDINIIMPDYVGYSGTDSAVIAARVDQIATDYPDLDYLFCFKSENLAMTKEAWQDCFLGYYNRLHTRCPNMKVVASGWGINPTWVTSLPPDVIAAPIAPYSATWENASAFGSREFWACPWMERDFLSSEYFYPYNINLSDTIQAYQSRSANTKGLYCLTWRITDAIDPKLSYIARAPWDVANVYRSSNSVYQEYAIKNYGSTAGGMVAGIIDQNEPFASNFGECEGTFPFDGHSSTAGNLFNVYWFKFYCDDPTNVSPIYASDYSSMYDVTKYSASEGGLCLGSISQGSWFKFNAISFDPSMNSFQVRVASERAGGGLLEIRLDSLTGTVIGTCVIRDTGAWQNWKNVEIPISSVSGTHAVYFKILRPDDRALASQQIALIDGALSQTADKVQQARLQQLRCRIEAAKAYIDLDLGGASTENLQNFVNLMGQLVKGFTYRIVDISSLGNVVSLQNRFVQLNYVNVIKALRNTQTVKMPSDVRARGTVNGSVISWDNEEPSVKGFNVYRNNVKLTSTALDAECTVYYDTFDGICTYSVTSLNDSDVESIQSPAEICSAGNADTDGPYIALVSPPTSVARNDGADIKVRLLDGRSSDLLVATCYYRPLGASQWASVAMTRRANAVFAVRINDVDIPAEGFEYYIAASDGTNESLFPADAPTHTMTSVVYGEAPQALPSMPNNAEFSNGVLHWQPATGDVASYNIYRSDMPDFEPSAASFLTYVGAATTNFIDNKFDYDGSVITEAKYYRITAVDITGHEGNPTTVIMAPPPDLTPTIRSFWNCDEISGTVCEDIFGDFDGIIQNASHNDNGKYGYCLDFNGTNGSVYISDSSLFEAYTIGTWIKVRNVRASSIIVRSSPSGPGSEYSHQLRINSAGKFEHYCYDGKTHTASGSTTVQTDRWYYVVISAKDRDSIKLYVNGKLEAAQVIDGNLWRGGDRWYWGIASAGIAYFNGLLDEVILLNSQLSDIEVNSLFCQGDLNGDHQIDFNDVLIFTQQWLSTTPISEEMLDEDIDMDGVVNFKDFVFLAKGWLENYDFD